MRNLGDLTVLGRLGFTWQIVRLVGGSHKQVYLFICKIDDVLTLFNLFHNVLVIVCVNLIRLLILTFSVNLIRLLIMTFRVARDVVLLILIMLRLRKYFFRLRWLLLSNKNSLMR